MGASRLTVPLNRDAQRWLVRFHRACVDGASEDVRRGLMRNVKRADPANFPAFVAAVNTVVGPLRVTDPAARTPRRGPRRRGAGRPGARRLTLVRGGDSGDDSDPEPPQARKPPALYFYGASTCPYCGNVLGYYDGRLYCPTSGCPWSVG